MFEKLEQLEAKYEKITRLISEPEILADTAKYQKHAKAHSDLTPIVEKFREYKQIKTGIADARQMILDSDSEEDLKKLAQEELAHLEARLAAVESELKVLLIPKDQRRKERAPGDSCRYRRRRSNAVCSGAL